MLSTVAQAIFDKKGMNIIVLDVRGISSITDYLVIAEGNVDRHVKAIGESVSKTLKEHGHQPLFIEGKTLSDWIVMDYNDVIIHIMTPAMRHQYELEKIWPDAGIVDVAIQVKSVS